MASCEDPEMNRFTAFSYGLKFVAFLKHAECLSSPELEQEQNKCIDDIGQNGAIDFCRYE